MTATDLLETARTLLFVPGDRPDRFAKAAASGAGLVILDLEDAVAPTDKDAARRHVTEWLARGHRCAVRINGAATSWHDEDLAAVAPYECSVVVPKAESPEGLARASRLLHQASVMMALVETAAGVLAAPAVASVAGVRRLALGTFDLGAELGVAPDDEEAMAWSRGAMVLASAAAAIAPPVDGVTAAVDDEERVRSDVRRAARIGFTGKLCIHPRQVGVVEDVLRPTEEELGWARSVVEAAEASAVVVVDGKMVDKPVVDRARRLLEQQARTPGS